MWVWRVVLHLALSVTLDKIHSYKISLELIFAGTPLGKELDVSFCIL